MAHCVSYWVIYVDDDIGGASVALHNRRDDRRDQSDTWDSHTRLCHFRFPAVALIRNVRIAQLNSRTFKPISQSTGSD